MERDEFRRIMETESVGEGADGPSETIAMGVPPWMARQIDVIKDKLGAKNRAQVFGRTILWVRYGVDLAEGGYEIQITKDGEVVESISNEEMRRGFKLKDIGLQKNSE